MTIYKKNLLKQGYLIIKPDSKKAFLKLQNEILKVVNSLFAKNNLRTFKNIYELIKNKKNFKHELINDLRKIYINKLNQKIVNTYSKNLKKIFNEEFFIQKYSTIRLMHPLISSSALNPHIEAHAGHSPFTFNIWTPYHEINDKSGIWLIPLRDSLEILKKEKNVKHRKKLIRESKNLFFPKFKEGESIILNSFVYHGSNIKKTKPVRISSDVRLQKKNSLFLYKFNEFFEITKLHA